MKTMCHILKADHGIVLLSAVLLLSALVLTSSTIFLMATTEMKIGGNYKQGERAFYNALSGCEEARARLREGAPHPIIDAYPQEAGWKAYVGNLENAKEKGFASGNSHHIQVDSLLPKTACIVELRHQTDDSGNILLWGDADGNGTNEKNTILGENVYHITSSVVAGGLGKVVQVEVARNPGLPVFGALYVKTTAVVQGSSTLISGKDSCGSHDISGIVSMGSTGSVAVPGGAEIIGDGNKNPNVTFDGKDLDLHWLVNTLQQAADFSYVVNASEQGPGVTPGPGDGWGTPTTAAAQGPLSCTDTRTIHYRTDGTYVRFANGVSGCGLLLVEGDLEVSGDFTWYGPIVATGSMLFTGGGNKRITGSVMAGESVFIGNATGYTSLLYCSKAIEAPTRKEPLRLLSWKE